MTKKATTGIDRHIAVRMRRRRLDVGVSQETLAEAIGVTFQQIQKYEKGINRISASRLHQVADALGVDASYFFQGIEKGAAGPAGDPLAEIYANRATVELVRAFNAIPSAQVRSAILQLVQASAESSALSGPPPRASDTSAPAQTPSSSRDPRA